MAERIKWVKRCIRCGKKESGGTTTTTGKPPSGGGTPSMSGRCPDTPDGKHRAEWVKG